MLDVMTLSVKYSITNKWNNPSKNFWKVIWKLL